MTVDPKLSRRSLFAIAGAGVVLAGCSRGTGQNDEKSAAVLGTNEPYGFNPHALPEGLSQVPFAPDYLTIVRIASPGAWRFSANHASFGIDDPASNTPEARLAQALRILRKVGPGRKFGALRPGKPDAEAKIYRRTDHGSDPDSGYDIDDFSKFEFASQHEIFVYYDSQDVTLEDANLLSFSHFLTAGAKRASMNDSFVVSRVPDDQLPANLKGKLIRIQNYNTIKEAGTFRRRDPAVATEKAEYSMNFHFTLPGVKPIPLVLDPDTGNGYGGQP